MPLQIPLAAIASITVKAKSQRTGLPYLEGEIGTKLFKAVHTLSKLPFILSCHQYHRVAFSQADLMLFVCSYGQEQPLLSHPHNAGDWWTNLPRSGGQGWG